MTYHSHADIGGERTPLAVEPEPEGDPFHAPWEPRAHALTIAMGATGSWNLDMVRAARETLPDYRQRSYYEIWYGGLVALLEREGLATAAELEAGRALGPARPVPRVLRAGEVGPMLCRGASTLREAAGPARFAVGDRVRASDALPTGHTRLPGYARGRRGIIEHVRGVHIFPDAHAAGRGEAPEWLYGVVFTAAELWGDDPSRAGQSVAIDLWEPYLEPA
jgi:nitrile hydratase subunit beta